MKYNLKEGVVELLWVMGVMVFFTLFIINGIELFQFVLQKTNAIDFGYVYEFNYLDSLILLTTAGILIYTFTKNKETTESDFILKTIENLFELAKKSIDHTPSRINWQTAAESMISINNFKEKLIPVHESYFQIMKDQFRTEMWESLEYVDASDKHRKPIEPAYFFGAKDWKDTAKNFEELYEIATKNKMIASTYSPYRSMAIPESTYIDCRYVIAVYSFINDALPLNTSLSGIRDWPEKMPPYIQQQPASTYVKWMQDNNYY